MTAEIPDILCLGEPMVEFVRDGGPDSDAYIAGVGGDISNAAIAAARQGAKVGCLTALGQDTFAERVLRLWEREGVNSEFVQRDAKAPTGLYVIEPDPETRHYSYFRAGSAASRYAPGDLPGEALNQARILHVSGITLAVSESLRAAALLAMQQVRSAGRDVSFDTNLRLKLWDADIARKATEEAARLASVVITSVEDSEILTGHHQPDAILAHYSGLGARIVILTLGAEGAVVSVDGKATGIDPAPAQPVDSTGAGDSFAGAFLAWWLETQDPLRAARLAAIVAAGTVSGLGAVEPIPQRDTVLKQAEKSGIFA